MAALLGINLAKMWAFKEEWLRLLGSSNPDEAKYVTVSKSGLYVVGRTEGVLARQMSAGGTDAFLIKYDPEGRLLWTRQFSIPLGFSVGGDPEGTSVGQVPSLIEPRQWP